jgi:hypothetical protein
MCPCNRSCEDERIPERRRRECDRDALARKEGIVRFDTGSCDVNVDDRRRPLPVTTLRAKDDVEPYRPAPMSAKMRRRPFGADGAGGAARMGRSGWHGVKVTISCHLVLEPHRAKARMA